MFGFFSNCYCMKNVIIPQTKSPDEADLCLTVVVHVMYMLKYLYHSVVSCPSVFSDPQRVVMKMSQTLLMFTFLFRCPDEIFHHKSWMSLCNPTGGACYAKMKLIVSALPFLSLVLVCPHMKKAKNYKALSLYFLNIFKWQFSFNA